jgi:poly(hydroxyalkanoate) depolymerase family esterase
MKTPKALLISAVLFFNLHAFAQEDVVHVPASLPAGERVPLVVMLHGCAQDAAGTAKSTQWDKMADEKKFIVLYPNLRNSKNKIKCWSFYDPANQAPQGDEVLAIKTAIDDAKARYPVDPSAVFLTGMSAGSAMVSVMVSCYPQEFRAAALHSGMPYGYVETWQESLKMAHNGPPANMREGAPCSPQDFRKPLMTIHGDNDPVVNKVNSDRIMEDFVMTPAVETKTKKVTSWDPRTRTYETTDYSLNHQLVGRKVLIHGLEHKWSGGPITSLFADPRGPSSTQLIWDFFQESR